MGHRFGTPDCLCGLVRQREEKWTSARGDISSSNTGRNKHPAATRNLTVPHDFIATSIIAHLKINCHISPHSISLSSATNTGVSSLSVFGDIVFHRAATGAATLTQTNHPPKKVCLDISSVVVWPMASCSRTLVIEDFVSDGDFGETDGFENKDRDLEGGDSDYNPEEDELRKDGIDEIDELYNEDDDLPQQPDGIHEDYAEDVFYVIDNVDAIGVIEFVNLTMEEVCWYHFADIDLAFEFYQSYAKHH
ncbi:hypothetical protein PIB30_056677 [Stylosanthes scabra]|uniref:Uncharacterized protein n=1 Tax=Stylosanthes scabra TaxID=79078 RepID=A0ABU6YGU3_9FABA|nr:hypothetical protein [Stylosanthes scabra]